MKRLLMSLTLVSAVSLSAAGNSDVNSRSVGNQAGSQASVSANRADKANILTRAATSFKDVFVNNARIFAHTGVAAITLPSIIHLAQYKKRAIANLAQYKKLYAAICGTGFGMYYTQRQIAARNNLSAKEQEAIEVLRELDQFPTRNK